MCFMYGDYDWMDRETADNLVKDGVKGEVHSVLDSGHHLYIENAAECVAHLLQCTHDENTANIFISSTI